MKLTVRHRKKGVIQEETTIIDISDQGQTRRDRGVDPEVLAQRAVAKSEEEKLRAKEKEVKQQRKDDPTSTIVPVATPEDAPAAVEKRADKLKQSARRAMDPMDRYLEDESMLSSGQHTGTPKQAGGPGTVAVPTIGTAEESAGHFQIGREQKKAEKDLGISASSPGLRKGAKKMSGKVLKKVARAGGKAIGPATGLAAKYLNLGDKMLKGARALGVPIPWVEDWQSYNIGTQGGSPDYAEAGALALEALGIFGSTYGVPHLAAFGAAINMSTGMIKKEFWESKEGKEFAKSLTQRINRKTDPRRVGGGWDPSVFALGEPGDYKSNEEALAAAETKRKQYLEWDKRETTDRREWSNCTQMGKDCEKFNPLAVVKAFKADPRRPKPANWQAYVHGAKIVRADMKLKKARKRKQEKDVRKADRWVRLATDLKESALKKIVKEELYKLTKEASMNHSAENKLTKINEGFFGFEDDPSETPLFLRLLLDNPVSLYMATDFIDALNYSWDQIKEDELPKLGPNPSWEDIRDTVLRTGAFRRLAPKLHKKFRTLPNRDQHTLLRMAFDESMEEAVLGEEESILAETVGLTSRSFSPTPSGPISAGGFNSPASAGFSSDYVPHPWASILPLGTKDEWEEGFVPEAQCTDNKECGSGAVCINGECWDLRTIADEKEKWEQDLYTNLILELKRRSDWKKYSNKQKNQIINELWGYLPMTSLNIKTPQEAETEDEEDEKNEEMTEEELLQEQLLIEGRIEDVKKKYPRIPKIIDYLIRRDPSGSQKYLAWAAKQTEAARQYRAQYTPPGTGLDVAQIESSWVPELTDKIEKFHKWNQRLPKFGFSKDINSYKDYESLRDAISKLEEEETQAKKRSEEKKAALSEAEVIDDTEDYFIVRPMSTESSCFFGRGTRWCISAEKSNNYFDSYTSEGKTFYFVFMKQVDPTNRYKKLAFVLDSDYDLESVFDAEDSELNEGEIEEAFIQNLLNQATAEGAWMAYLWYDGGRYADEATKEDSALYNQALERLGIGALEADENGALDMEEAEYANSEIREQTNSIQIHVMEQMRDHAYHNPAGPTEADYQKIQDEFEQSAEHAYLYFDEYEEGKYYYNGGMSFEFNDLEWIDEHADNDDVIGEIVREVADDHYVYVDEIEVYNEDARLDFNPDYDESGVDGFKAMADRILEYDGHWQEIYDGVISKLKGLRLIPAPDMEREREYWPSDEEKEKQLELPGIISESKNERIKNLYNELNERTTYDDWWDEFSR